ncbi:MAG: YciI family protein [Pseudomonadota bacterium]
MPRFMFAYHGGGMPETEEAQQAAMQAWGAWIESNAAAMPDPGAPVGQSKTVSGTGVEDHGGANPISGYAFVEADSIEAAAEIAKGCPIIQDGGTVEIAPIMEM